MAITIGVGLVMTLSAVVTVGVGIQMVAGACTAARTNVGFEHSQIQNVTTSITAVFYPTDASPDQIRTQN